MTINLNKGGRINLSKTAPGLKRVRVGLGWKPNAFSTGTDFDLDASAFVCSVDAAGNSKLLSDSYFIFYNQSTDPEGAMKHSGDSKDGKAGDIDETITIDLAKLNPQAADISFIVTIHDAVERKQNFGQVSNSVIALFDDETGVELAKYSLEDDFSNETAVQFGSLYKKDGQWLFKAVGAGFQKGLADFVTVYGGNLA